MIRNILNILGVIVFSVGKFIIITCVNHIKVFIYICNKYWEMDDLDDRFFLKRKEEKCI